MTTSQALKLIDEMKKAGTKRVSLIGGEPLLREDINVIVNTLKKKEFHITITSNGILVPEKIDLIKKIDLLKLSYDGPKHIHEKNRGNKTYGFFLNALNKSRKNKINTILNTTITKNNKRVLEKLVLFAEKRNVNIKFQPTSNIYSFQKDISGLSLNPKCSVRIGQKLMELKKKYRNIINSRASIEYLFMHKRKTPKKCPAGNILCKISAEGDIYPCTVKQYSEKKISAMVNGFQKAFQELDNTPCDNCMCSSTQELTNLYNFKIDSLINVVKTPLLK